MIAYDRHNRDVCSLQLVQSENSLEQRWRVDGGLMEEVTAYEDEADLLLESELNRAVECAPKIVESLTAAVLLVT
jgi:hypothetical protein